MKNKKYWKNNGTEDSPIYDFIMSEEFTRDRIEDQIRSEIENLIKTGVSNEDWSLIFSRLPCELKEIVLLEIKNGNKITSIQSGNWPSKKSIVVTMLDRFQKESKSIPKTYWRLVNDPHYYREEISQAAENIENLIIT